VTIWVDGSTASGVRCIVLCHVMSCYGRSSALEQQGRPSRASFEFRVQGFWDIVDNLAERCGPQAEMVQEDRGRLRIKDVGCTLPGMQVQSLR